ncbi:MAG: ROK family protein [bacterium]
MKRGNIKLMKKMNTSFIIKEINENGPLSRSDLKVNTGLSPTTITTLINEMVEDNLVIEVGERESSGGRKPILLDLNPKYAYILSGWISSEKIFISLIDIKYNILEIIEQEIIFPSNDNLINQIKSIIDKLINSNDISKEKIIGLILGISGIINQKEGLIKYSAHLDLKNFSIRQPLSKYYSFPIYIENDTNLIALSEKKFGYKNINNFIYIMIGPELGSGIIIDDKIYRGNHGQAGEFGHLLVKENGPICSCGRKGCLTPVLSEYIPLENAKNFRNSFNNLNKNSKEYKLFCHYLSLSITNYIHLFDNQAVIFGGELGKIASEQFYLDIKNRIIDYSIKDVYKNIKILPASLNDNEVLKGGANFCFKNSEYFLDEGVEV